MTKDQVKERERNLKAGFPDLQIPADKTPMELFVEQYLSHYLRHQTPDFHRDIYWMLQNRHIYSQLLLTAPRFFAKSVLCILFDVMYDICVRANPAAAEHKNVYEPDLKEICFACETATKAKKWMRFIRREITGNQKILEDFGDLSTSDIRDEQWNQEVMTFKTGLTIYGFGCEKGRGEHPQKLILDDIESKESARSKDRCDNVEEWIKSTLFGMFEDEFPPITWVGTMLRAGCVIDNAYEGHNWDDSWYRRKWDCYDDENNSIWPDRWSNKKLKIREKKQGSIIFGQEMRNKAYGSMNPVYRRHHFHNKYYKPEELPKNLYVVTGNDPAIGEKRRNDEAALCVVGLCMSGKDKMKIFVLEVDHGRWGTNGIITRNFSFFHAYHPKLILFETNAFQEVLAQDFEAEALDRGIYPDIKRVNQTVDKWTRASNVVSLFDMGLVYFLEGDPKQKDLINQLINFPGVSHDDMHDSLEICLKHIKTYVNMLKLEDGEDEVEDDDFRSVGMRKLGRAS